MHSNRGRCGAIPPLSNVAFRKILAVIYLADAHLGITLTVPELATIVLAALVLEDDDILATAVLDDFGGDRRFTTWARKYAVRAAAVAMRSRQAALSA